MRIVLINHCHPDRPHVCGLRAGRFAAALADRGHQVVVICEALPDAGFDDAPRNLRGALAAHDWRSPYILARRPVGHDLACRGRHGELPSGIRHLVIALTYLIHGGMFPDWQAGVRPDLQPLAEAFKPDVIWGTFGNTDTWRLCNELSRFSQAPWIADFKDNWLAFVPFGLRTLMARRFGAIRQMTTLSNAHCDQADDIFPNAMKSILYSGVDSLVDVVPEPATDGLRILLTGSIYDEAMLRRFCLALGSWSSEPETPKVILIYAGNDGETVDAIARRMSIDVHVKGYLAQDELHQLQADVSVNAYLFNPICLLHHKALELIASGRPIIAFGGETAEVQDLAARAGTMLFPCTGDHDLGQALDLCRTDPHARSSHEKRAAFTWSARAAVLEDVLSKAVAAHGGTA